MTRPHLWPVFAFQAAWVVARASRLPEASGARQGTAGQGDRLRLLILGDSSAAGTGVATQDLALSGRIAAYLATGRAVDWTLIARSGGTARSTLRLLAGAPDARYDAAIVCLGVNDAKNGVPRPLFARRMEMLLDVLTARFGTRRIVLSGLAPLHRFPILPAPLNTAIGTRATLFDATLRALADQRQDAVHIPLDPDMDLSLLARDGFHPGPAIYAEWGVMLANAVRDVPSGD